MNDNRNKKDFHSPKKKTFNKSGNTNSKFGGKKQNSSKYSSTEKGKYSKKSSAYSDKRYDSSAPEKEYKRKKYDNDKPFSREDSNVNKTTDSKYSKPYKDKKPYNREDKPYHSEKTPYKKIYKKDNDYDEQKTYSKSYNKKESTYSNDRYEKKEPAFKKKLVKKDSFNKANENNTYANSFDNEREIGNNSEYGSKQSSFRKKITKRDMPYENEIAQNFKKSFKGESTLYSESKEDKPLNRKKLYSATEKSVKTITPHKADDDGAIRLNKYIASSGICSRREADDLIISGAVKVNGKVVTELGTKVLPTDEIQYGGETLRNEKNVYLLLNKPKDFITTSDDPFNRKTVMSLVDKACKERIYPVGRLDRMTTGLLLFTNDGEMAKKLTHPKHNIKKIYQVELDKPLTKADMAAITDGIELEDGLIKVDVITYVGDGADKKTLGLELHSGKNRIVRRIFEHFGYNVVKLDRVYFAGLTKKDLPRGRYRFLTEAEINMLKVVS